MKLSTEEKLQAMHVALGALGRYSRESEDATPIVVDLKMFKGTYEWVIEELTKDKV